MSWVAPLLVGLLLLLSLRLSRDPLRSKSWQLLRVLLPSWRFFEDIEAGPRLWLCVRGAEPNFGEWQLALVPPQRRASSLLLDAEANCALAYQSVVEQLWSELDGLDTTEVPNLVSYELVRLIAERRARLLLPEAGGRYRFGLSDGAAGDATEGFISPELEL